MKQVMANQTDLVDIVVELKPLAVMKGIKMKTTIKTEEVSDFKPKELVIVLDNEEEYGILCEIMAMNVSIPELVEGRFTHKAIEDLMTQIHDTLVE